MKKFLWVAVAGLAVVLAGCSDSPKTVTEKWHDAIVSGDLETANKYSTDSMQSVNKVNVGLFAKDDHSWGNKLIPGQAENFRNMKFGKEEISGDIATVYFNDDKGQIQLRKVDGDWKVNMF